jgi:hypothetical protein
MTKTKKFHDPDFGTMEVPIDAFPTREEVEARRQELRRIQREHRLWEDGRIYDCVVCHQKALVGRSDLVEEIFRPGQIHSIRHLHGAKCTACNSQFLEPSEIVEIEDELGVGIIADFEAKVSNIGSGTLGTYWPRDVVRNMALTADKKAYIRVLDRDTAIVKFARGSGKTASMLKGIKKNSQRPQPTVAPKRNDPLRDAKPVARPQASDKRRRPPMKA